MTMLEAVKSCFSKYAVFSGRARRSEFWYFYLFNVIIYFIMTGGLTGAMAGGTHRSTILGGVMGSVYGLYSLATVLPTLAVTWRRLHDVGKSGAVYFLPLIPMAVLMAALVAMLVQSDLDFLDTLSAGVSIGLVLGLGGLYVAMLILAVVVIVWLAKEGQYGPNKYGPDPKALPEEEPPFAYAAPGEGSGDKAPWEY